MSKSEKYSVYETVLEALKYHDTYLKMFQEMHEYLLYGEGQLSFTDRCLIAIMAAGRHRCCCLIKLMKSYYIEAGGDSKVFKNLNNIPVKLRNLDTVNKMLAHKPWLLNKTHIQILVQNKWLLSEVCQALVLLAHFHSLSTLIFSLGLINDDPSDHCCNARIAEQSSESDSASSVPLSRSASDQFSEMAKEPDFEMEELLKRLKAALLKKEASSKLSEEEHTEKFKNAGIESMSIKVVSKKRDLTPKEALEYFNLDPEFAYEDFMTNGINSANILHTQEFNWSDHGASVMNSMYSNIGDKLDEKFKLAFTMTYQNLGPHKDVDTRLWRTALWAYIRLIFGIRHDDYRYNHNEFLSKRLKTFVKNSICFPERVTVFDYNSVMSNLDSNEKAHINIIIFEAKLEIELLYAARALDEFLKMKT